MWCDLYFSILVQAPIESYYIRLGMESLCVLCVLCVYVELISRGVPHLVCHRGLTALLLYLLPFLGQELAELQLYGCDLRFIDRGIYNHPSNGGFSILVLSTY